MSVDSSMSYHTHFGLSVYYEDTDAGGVVYHSNYLNFMERARSEWLNELGWSVNDCAQELGVIFVVKSVNVDFNSPAKLMDKLEVRTRIIQVGKVSLEMQQDIYNLCDLGNQQPICSGFVRLATLDSNKFSMILIPPEIRDAMQAQIDG